MEAKDLSNFLPMRHWKCLSIGLLIWFTLLLLGPVAVILIVAHGDQLSHRTLGDMLLAFSWISVVIWLVSGTLVWDLCRKHQRKQLLQFVRDVWKRCIRGSSCVAWGEDGEHVSVLSRIGAGYNALQVVPESYRGPFVLFGIGGLFHRPGVRTPLGRLSIMRRIQSSFPPEVVLLRTRARLASIDPEGQPVIELTEGRIRALYGLKELLLALRLWGEHPRGKFAGNGVDSLESFQQFLAECATQAVADCVVATRQRDGAFRLLTKGLRTLSSTHLIGRSKEAERWVRETSGEFARILPASDSRQGEFEALYDRMFEKLIRREQRNPSPA